MSRPGVDKSLECDFIKVILTKDQERSKGVRETKSGCIELNRTHCYTEKFNAASVCAESRGSLSIFPRVSWKQLLKYHGP